MDLGLHGRTAIVCGASSGMGLASARALAAEGARVVLFADEAQALKEAADSLQGVAVHGDLRSADDRRRLIEVAREPDARIDVLVLNGGGPPLGTAADIDLAELSASFELLVLPMVDLVQRCLADLKLGGRGRVIAITSSAVREPIPGLALSNSIRPGLVGWLKTLACEVASSGVTVNAVAPGRIESRTLATFYAGNDKEHDLGQIPCGRFGTTAEVGDVVCFLAAVQASYITGAVVPIDGGLTRCLL